MQITPATKVVGLIGRPVAHSFSPILHNSVYQSLELDMVYHAFDVAPDKLEEAIDGFVALGFLGFNVTIPYKEKVCTLLNSIETEAQIIGAVNTVKIENGVLKGYNTDGQGFIMHMKKSGFSFYGKNIAILGAGGASRAVSIYTAKEGAASIQIINRTFSKADTLAGIINDYIGGNIAKASLEIPPNADFIINTTSLGMWPNIKTNPLEGFKLSEHTIVCDIVYNPRKTAMLKYAQKQGCKICDGIGMLIGQAIRTMEIWLDHPIPKNIWKNMNHIIDGINY